MPALHIETRSPNALTAHAMHARAGLSANAQRMNDGADDRDPFRAVGRTIAVARGAIVFEEGDPAEAYFRVVSGSLRLYRMTEDGKRQIIAFLHPGQFFGLETDDTHQFSVDALSSATIQRLPRTQVTALIRGDSALGGYLFAMLRDQLMSTQQRLVLGRFGAKARVASFLVMLSRRDGKAGATRDIHLAMSRSDIADFLGLAVETISRAIGEFKEKAIISLVNPQHIAIRNLEVLEEIAKGEVDGLPA